MRGKGKVGEKEREFLFFWSGFSVVGLRVSKERACKGRNRRNWEDGSKERLPEFISSSDLIYFQVPLLVIRE
ncbi:hypothetical protein NE237_007422 [Protea cynaroides]|uniref:Uncharacterized protein n=1 Tax=Protea cynaroides TaxID=273540 RepID=A0A9Q0QW78_9MAGN|nr:hypothetical protein NE237_007422 [Protea cynaroides]